MERKLLLIIFIFICGCSNNDNGNERLKKYSFYVNAEPSHDWGRVTINIGGNASDVAMNNPIETFYDEGTLVTIKAIPSEEYMFTGWASSYTGLENPITLTMDSDKLLIAFFTLEDEDGDGVNFLNDLCSETPPGEVVDENGCSDSQKD